MHSVPESRILGAFINSLTEQTQIAYVEKELKPQNLSWAQIQLAFIKRFTDKALPEKLKQAYENCKQRHDQTVAQYAQDFQELVRRLNYESTNPTVVDTMERGYKQNITDKLKQRRVVNMQLYDTIKPTDPTAVLSEMQQAAYAKTRPFPSLAKLSEQAVEVEAELISTSPYRHGARSRKTSSRKHSSKRRGGSAKANTTKADSQSNQPDSSSAASNTNSKSNKKDKSKNNRLGLTPDGVPAHTGPKKSGRGGGRGRGKGKGDNSRKGKSSIVCFNCNKPGHSQAECRKNLEKCKLCSAAGHMFTECPLYRPPARSRALTAALFQADNESAISVSCTRLGSTPLLNVLLDSGAEFSAISKHVVDKYNILPTPVPVNEDQGVAGVDKSMKVKRLGTVILPITVTYPLGGHDASVSFTKKFEVMDLDEDVLLGVETWMTLFPNFEGERCLIKPASITTPPSQIKYHKAAHIYRVVASEPVSSANSASSSSKGETEADIYDYVEESDIIEIGSVELGVQETCRIFAMHATDVDQTLPTIIDRCIIINIINIIIINSCTD